MRLFFERDDPEPERLPLEQGQLVPPSRRPPTAVATATPRPPGRPSGTYPDRLGRVAKAAHSMMATALIAGGLALTTVPPLGVLLGPLACVLGLNVITKTFAQLGLLRYLLIQHHLGYPHEPAVGKRSRRSA